MAPRAPTNVPEMAFPHKSGPNPPMKRAVLVVCDGLRADMVTPELTLNLVRLAGHTFSTASPVFGTCLVVERTLMFAF